MDFGNATLVVAFVIGGTELIKRLGVKLGVVIDDGLTQVVAMLVAALVLFLGRETVWATTELIGEHPLKALSWADLVFASFGFGLVGNVGDRILRTVANVGENNPKPPGTIEP